MFRKYAQLGRMHTTPLEAVPAVMGALVGIGRFETVPVLLWGLWGALYHYGGYALNSVADWEKGYDKDDPHKQHHPLNSGELSLEDSKIVTIGMLFMYVNVSILLFDWEILGFLFLGVQFLSGVAYNYLGKETPFKFMFIAAAHACSFLIPVIVLSEELIPLLAVAGTTYVFFWVVYQISVSGELKDFKQDEANWLKHLGSETAVKIPDSDMHEIQDETEHIVMTRGCQAWFILCFAGLAISLLSIVLLMPTAETALALYGIAVSMFSFGGVVLYRSRMEADPEYDRPTLLRQMSIIEMLTLFAFVLSMSPLIGPIVSISICAISVLWVVSFNKWQWGTILSPSV